MRNESNQAASSNRTHPEALACSFPQGLHTFEANLGSGIDISVRADFRALEKSLDYFARQQIPFAESEALTSIARSVVTAQVAALPGALHKKPTAFTMNAFGVIPSRKSTLQAVVFAKSKQAEYLAPSETGGPQVLGNKRALLNPKDIQLNASGNIPRGTIGRLKGRADIFFGQVTTTKSGPVSGIWQRVNVTRTGNDRKHHRKRGSVYHPQYGALKLLVRWGQGVEVSSHLGYHDRSQLVVQQSYEAAFRAAMSKALSTSRTT